MRSSSYSSLKDKKLCALCTLRLAPHGLVDLRHVLGRAARLRRPHAVDLKGRGARAEIAECAPRLKRIPGLLDVVVGPAVHNMCGALDARECMHLDIARGLGGELVVCADLESDRHVELEIRMAAFNRMERAHQHIGAMDRVLVRICKLGHFLGDLRIDVLHVFQRKIVHSLAKDLDAVKILDLAVVVVLRRAVLGFRCFADRPLQPKRIDKAAIDRAPELLLDGHHNLGTVLLCNRGLLGPLARGHAHAHAELGLALGCRVRMLHLVAEHHGAAIVHNHAGMHDLLAVRAAVDVAHLFAIKHLFHPLDLGLAVIDTDLDVEIPLGILGDFLDGLTGLRWIGDGPFDSCQIPEETIVGAPELLGDGDQ
eukprot:comp21568_c0_seq1/m.47304 comp21568_c0_seq1/g.47304  ORF comp21568_c0_seq1/g.47304 comp21568_c0_seq1/m.47304 type:complete len:368 (+) comp21568_c0_seq1:93-1196(+)